MDTPWTRDGRVRADIVQVTPDVSGLVAEISVRNNQAVKKGDVLFRIDPIRFELALREAEAMLAAKDAAAQEAVREMNRYLALTNLEISIEKQQQRSSTAAEARAAYQKALADRDVARLNLERATVRASVNGIVSNFSVRPGDYATAGNSVFALVDTDSIYVAGYFQETKLRDIRVGDRVEVHLMGEVAAIEGHVESIAGGIADRELSDGPSRLANVNPTFSWVRLAQRVPVRVALDHVPDGMRLIAGRTATVVILPAGHR
ncbi:MAG: HlyD family secretion protein [Reyranella sp.]|nr:HlyD family secretion protein [Reyranella sp.]